MKKTSMYSRLLPAAWLAAAMGLVIPFGSTVADSPGNTAADDHWQLKAELYGWLPTIAGTLPTGDDIEITIDEIVDNLDFTFMGVFQARRDEWAVVADAVYLKLSADDAGVTTMPIGPLNVPTRVDLGFEMKAWIVNLAGAYRIHQADRFDVQVLAGARYLSLDVGAEPDTSLIPGEKVVGGRDQVWDAIIGVRGLADLSDNWWLTYRFDIGTGDSDLTWNASLQFGRKFDWGSLAFGYRYLHYDFAPDFNLMKDLDIYGPVIGAAWEF
jgi:hypothetical protein